MHAWNMFVYVYEFLVYISRQLCFHYHIARFSFVIFFLGGFICNACTIQRAMTGPFMQSLDILLLQVSSE